MPENGMKQVADIQHDVLLYPCLTLMCNSATIKKIIQQVKYTCMHIAEWHQSDCLIPADIKVMVTLTVGNY